MIHRCDVYLVRTDSLGDSLWIKTFGGDGDQLGESIQKTMDGGYIIAGAATSPAGNSYDVYLIKTDSLGDSLWAKTFGGSDYDRGCSVKQTADKGYIIAGWTRSFGSDSSNIYLVKTDSLGDSLWAKTFGGDSAEYGFSVDQTNDKGYIITGSTNSFGSGSSDVYLVKTDSLGDSLWAKTFGGSFFDYGTSVLQTADGGYIITGYCYNDAYLIKTNSYGDTLWTKNLLGGAGNSVLQTADGGYIVTGISGGFCVYLVKVNSETGIGQEITPDVFSVSGCNPNPFSNKTTLSYELPERGYINVSVYNILGQKVKKLESGIKNSGIHTITWNGTNDSGEKLCSGIYILRAKAGEKQVTEKLVLLR